MLCWLINSVWVTCPSLFIYNFLSLFCFLSNPIKPCIHFFIIFAYFFLFIPPSPTNNILILSWTWLISTPEAITQGTSQKICLFSKFRDSQLSKFFLAWIQFSDFSSDWKLASHKPASDTKHNTNKMVRISF